MARKRVFRSVLLATSALLIAACASQPASKVAPESVPDKARPGDALLEKKFQLAAKQYQQFQHEGQTLYCQQSGTKSMPYDCLTEARLRQKVEIFERERNPIARPLMPGAGQTGIAWRSQ